MEGEEVRRYVVTLRVQPGKDGAPPSAFDEYLVGYLEGEENPFLGDYGPKACGGYDGPTVAGVSVAAWGGGASVSVDELALLMDRCADDDGQWDGAEVCDRLAELVREAGAGFQACDDCGCVRSRLTPLCWCAMPDGATDDDGDVLVTMPDGSGVWVTAAEMWAAPDPATRQVWRLNGGSWAIAWGDARIGGLDSEASALDYLHFMGGAA